MYIYAYANIDRLEEIAKKNNIVGPSFKRFEINV